MRIPKNMTEAEVVEAINRATAALAQAYKFGYHSAQDIRQEGWIIALEVLEKEVYDCKRPLYNFLVTHLRNRLSNNKRKQFHRNDPPCTLCHEFYYRGDRNCCAAAQKAGSTHCLKYAQWRERNSAKQNLMNMLGLSLLDVDSEAFASTDDSGLCNLETSEVLDILDEELTLSERKLLLKVRAGEVIPSDKMCELRSTIKTILTSRGVYDKDV